MKKEKKDILLEEHLRKIKYRVDYIINESPKYRPLVSNGEEFDEVPNLTNEAGEQEDAEKPGGGQTPPAPSNDLPVDTGMPPAEMGGQDAGMPPAEDPLIGGPQAADPMGASPMGGAPVEQPEQQVNDLQNDIIKHNIEAMKSIHSQLEQLNGTVQGLNAKLAELNADVEEVREPSNTEKLMSKTNVSYPYYFNLNDFWSGNWFNQKREQEHEKGIQELPDGSYVADFDELPRKSKSDIQNSFNDIT